MGERMDVTRPDRIERALRHAAAKINPQTSWAQTLWKITNDMPVKRRALKTWIAEGMELETCQITIKFGEDGEPSLSGAWAPGARLVEHVASTHLRWNTGSHAEFPGTVGYTADAETWVGGYEWGANTLVVVIHRRLS